MTALAITALHTFAAIEVRLIDAAGAGRADGDARCEPPL
jgi:hypothetical protein